MGITDHEVMYPDGSSPYVLDPPPLPTWTDAVIGEAFDGATITGGEATVLWEWADTIATASPNVQALPQTALDAIIARIDTRNRIRIRTLNAQGQYVVCDARTDKIPSHTKADAYALGLRVEFRRVVPV